MSLVILPAKRTPLSADQATQALATAYERLTGSKPTFPVLALLVGQSAFETGSWTSFSNYNFAGIKAGSHELIQQLPTTEVINGVSVKVYPPDPAANFAAYESAADGAYEYLKLLQKRSHWWAGLLTGDLTQYVTALKTTPAYFTGDKNTYINGMARHIKDYTETIKAYSSSSVSNLVSSLLIAGVVTGGIIYGSKKIKEKLA